VLHALIFLRCSVALPGAMELIEVGRLIGDDENGVKIVKNGLNGMTSVRKVVTTTGLPEAFAKTLLGESEILRELNHPYIVRLSKELEVSAERLDFTMEYLTGGDCKALLQEVGGSLNEVSTSVLAAQVLSALHYCHTRGIMHRDVKTDNLVLVRPAVTDDQCKTELCCKLIDFGFATRCDEPLRAVIGSTAYMAPEVFSPSSDYDFKADIWGVGAVVFELLTGAPPFGRLDEQGSDRHIKAKIRKCTRSGNMEEDFLQAPAWQKLTQNAQSFLRSLLQADPKLRPTAKQALSHEWVRIHQRICSAGGG